MTTDPSPGGYLAEPALPWPPRSNPRPPAPLDRYETPPDLVVVVEGLRFPEGPIACADGSVLVVEVRGGTLCRVQPSGAVDVIADLGGGPNGAAIGPDDAVYVCNNGGLPWSQLADGSWYPVDADTGSMTPPDYKGGWIERVDLASGRTDRLYDSSDARSLSAPNDIVFDAHGDMWVTDTGKTGVDTSVLGAVYRARPDGAEISTVAYGLAGPNGIGLSPDEKFLYVADTPTGRIWCWSIDDLPAAPSPRQHAGAVIARLPGSIALDSLAVDGEGRIVVALPGAGALATISPDGSMWLVEVPDPMPTNICFGGPEGRTAFVTLGATGRLVSFDWPATLPNVAAPGADKKVARMPIDPSTAGVSVGPIVSSWDERDCMFYALSVGACMDDVSGPELQYVTENSRGIELVALPTMATVLGGVLTAPSPLAQIGDYDRRATVHGSVELELHRPLPTAGTVESTITVEGIFDKGSGALVVLRIDAQDDLGPTFTIRNGIFVRGEGGFGGEPGPPWLGGPSPDRPPDAETHLSTRDEQPLFYRLNGDRNPLHSDPTFAASAGFDRPILHGLCTLGFVGHALVAHGCDGDASQVARLGARFSAPALPGEVIETRIWDVGDELRFAAFVDDRAVLTSGYVTLR